MIKIDPEDIKIDYPTKENKDKTIKPYEEDNSDFDAEEMGKHLDKLAESLKYLGKNPSTTMISDKVDIISKKISNIDKKIENYYDKAEKVAEYIEEAKLLYKKLVEEPSVVNVVTVDDTQKYSGKMIVHEMYETALICVANKDPLILHGEAGTGKSFGAKQIAKSLELEWHFMNCITEEHQIMGWMNADGVYQPTPFYEAYKNGGLLCLDEIDASIPEVMIKMNMAIANGEMIFPNNEVVKMNKDFAIVGCANSLTGATEDYTGRQRLDAATLDRFSQLYWTYDEKLERKLVPDDVFGLFATLRVADERNKIGAIFSTRGMLKFAKLMNTGIPLKLIGEMVLWRGVEPHEFHNLTDYIPHQKIVDKSLVEKFEDIIDENYSED